MAELVGLLQFLAGYRMIRKAIFPLLMHLQHGAHTHTAHRLTFAYFYCNIKSKQILREIRTRFDAIYSLVP